MPVLATTALEWAMLGLCLTTLNWQSTNVQMFHTCERVCWNWVILLRPPSITIHSFTQKAAALQLLRQNLRGVVVAWAWCEVLEVFSLLPHRIRLHSPESLKKSGPYNCISFSLLHSASLWNDVSNPFSLPLLFEVFQYSTPSREHLSNQPTTQRPCTLYKYRKYTYIFIHTRYWFIFRECYY